MLVYRHDVTKVGDFYNAGLWGKSLSFVDSSWNCDVTKVGDFYDAGLWGKSLAFVESSWNCVPGYIKNVDTHHESFS